MHVAFMEEYLQPWYGRQRITIKRAMIFMHDNTPLHSAIKTTEYLQQMGFCVPLEKKWPPCTAG